VHKGTLTTQGGGNVAPFFFTAAVQHAADFRLGSGQGPFYYLMIHLNQFGARYGSTIDDSLKRF
jgi:hypothetical protein